MNPVMVVLGSAELELMLRNTRLAGKWHQVGLRFRGRFRLGVASKMLSLLELRLFSSEERYSAQSSISTFVLPKAPGDSGIDDTKGQVTQPTTNHDNIKLTKQHERLMIDMFLTDCRATN
jgi:hypothetical protein